MTLHRHSIRLPTETTVSDIASDAAGLPHARPIIDTDTPHSARLWNYFLGGRDHYIVDQAAAASAERACPAIGTWVKEAHRFRGRAVRHLAGAGVRQFLDIGVGLPAPTSTHEMAQSIVPTARVAYVDNCPNVLAHARALLRAVTPDGTTGVIDGDIHEPDAIMAAAATTLDLGQPVAAVMVNVLGHARSAADMRRAIAVVMSSLAPGSYVVLCDAVRDGANKVTNAAHARLWRQYAQTGADPYQPRSVAELQIALGGLDIEAPGLVPAPQWRPELTVVGQTRRSPFYVAVARKPMPSDKRETSIDLSTRDEQRVGKG